MRVRSGLTGTYSYTGGVNLVLPMDVVVVPSASKWNGDSTGLTFLVLNGDFLGNPLCRYLAEEKRLYPFAVTRTTAQRQRPFFSACFDPSDSNRVFLADEACVYSADANGHLALIAGGENGLDDDAAENRDGIGSDARFGSVYELVCNGDGSILYVADARNKCIRTIELSTRTVCTLPMKSGARSFDCEGLCWDRTHGVEPDSELYISSARVITRLNIVSGNTTTHNVCFCPFQMICTVGGYLVASSVVNSAIYSIDTRTFAAAALIAGIPDEEGHFRGESGHRDGEVWREATFAGPSGIALLEREQVLVVVDTYNHCLRSVPLPATLSEIRPLLEIEATTTAASTVDS
jgi:hypothetical protein